MQHKQNLSPAEKFEACLHLSDFTFKAMEKMLGRVGFREKLKRLREKHLEADYAWLRQLGNYQNEK